MRVNCEPLAPFTGIIVPMRFIDPLDRCRVRGAYFFAECWPSFDRTEIFTNYPTHALRI